MTAPAFNLVERNLELFPDLHPALDSQSAAAESNRCLFCFDAPCTAACPTHIDVPRFIKKIATGNLRGSALTILDSNILGLSCSRVCPVDILCEGACVMHRYNKKPIEIGLLQRHAMEQFYSSERFYSADTGLPVATAANPRKVACIGAGPASLACAAELRRHGHAVTIFERQPLPGGLNTYGVAEYKLRPSVSLQEVEMIRALGVEFQQAEIDAPALDGLEQTYDFIFIGIGLGAMDRLNIPGEDLPHVINALRFIQAYKTQPGFQAGNRVAVIGAGNTALDAANAARRLGATEVHVLYRRTAAEMPAFPFEYENSKLEGVQFHWNARPVAITPTGVRLANQEAEFPADQVIPALGQSRHSDLTARIDNQKIFGGGDCANGGREVVDAVAEGKRAAQKMVAHA